MRRVHLTDAGDHCNLGKQCSSEYCRSERWSSSIWGKSVCAGVSRGKGQDLFLRAFLKAVNLVRESSVVGEALRMHALLVGSDWSAFKYETMLREFVEENGLGRLVHFVNKSMNVAPYLAASDVLVQNSQVQIQPYCIYASCNLCQRKVLTLLVSACAEL